MEILVWVKFTGGIGKVNNIHTIASLSSGLLVECRCDSSPCVQAMCRYLGVFWCWVPSSPDSGLGSAEVPGVDIRGHYSPLLAAGVNRSAVYPESLSEHESSFTDNSVSWQGITVVCLSVRQMVEILAFVESKICFFRNRIFTQCLLLIQLLTYLEMLT